ncbi:hypothetical protein V5799_006163 [Amblyomma americanum]|uniref:PPM-type phosphatase domain-containing protein n=1 Tax=Amblyomma americanum TaxID=6943 RepID=A0AAQ4DX61_AMBAM
MWSLLPDWNIRSLSCRTGTVRSLSCRTGTVRSLSCRTGTAGDICPKGICLFVLCRQWPLSLSTVLAKTVAHQMNTSLKLKAGGYTEEDLAVGRLRTAALEALAEQCTLWRERPELAQELPHTPAASLPVSAHGVRNNRRKMEDRHLALPDLNFALGLQGLPQCSYYAVFDGHAGVEAADYATAHLHRNIAAQPDFVTDPVNAMREGFKVTDRNFLQRSSKEGLKSGCTAVCCLVREQRQLVVGWLGDSQAILVRKGVPMQLVVPHKPEREDERKRIEELGGLVLLMGIWRVNGTLGVSRAIGDAEHKPYVTSDPDVISLDLDGTEDFLVLGCDGLWDQLSPQDVAARVYHAVLDDPESAPYVSHTLVQGARDLGSSDNITAVVVFLRDPRDFDPSVIDITAALAPEKTAASELPTPPIEDLKEAFSGSEFDAAKFNSNGFGDHVFNADAVNSHIYDHGNENEIVQVASGVVRETIETALHRVNEDVITAGQIVDQVHLLHTEKEGSKFPDLAEQFHGAVPADDGLEVKFDQPDGMPLSANGYGDGIPEQHHRGRQNPFDDEGYGHDLETSEYLQSSPTNVVAAHEQGSADCADHLPSFSEVDNTGSSQAEQLVHEQTFLTATDVTPKPDDFSVGSEQELDLGQPLPVSPCVEPEKPLPTAPEQLPAAEPEVVKEVELPDEGVDLTTLPEDVQELEAATQAKEQPATQSVCDEKELAALPCDQQDLQVPETSVPSLGSSEAAETVPEFATYDNAALYADQQDQQDHQDRQDLHEEIQQVHVEPEFATHDNATLLDEQEQHLYEDVQPAQLAQPEYLSADHFKDDVGDEPEALATSLGFTQPLSVQSDDLVSIDLDSSAVQSLAETGDADVVHHDQPAGEALESLGTDDAEDNSMGGSAESVVEKVAAEPEQQDSAVIFCELKEAPAIDNLETALEDHLVGFTERNVDGLGYNIPVEQQEQGSVPETERLVSDGGDLAEKLELDNSLSRSLVEEPCAIRAAAESLPTCEENVCQEPSLLSVGAELQSELQASRETAASPVDLSKPCEELHQAISDSVGDSCLHPQRSPVIDELLEQSSPALMDVQHVSDSVKAAVGERPAPVVDIGAIPENIPEADGVTEDSDSERDSGWRFVKPVEPEISPSSGVLTKEEPGAVFNLSVHADEETIHLAPKEVSSSEQLASPVTDVASASEQKADVIADLVPVSLPEAKVEVAAEQKPEQKVSAPKAATSAKPSPAAQKTKPAGRGSPALKPKASSIDKPPSKTGAWTEISAKAATTTTKSPVKRQPIASKPASAASTPKASGTPSAAAKKETGTTRRSEPLKPRAAASPVEPPTKKPVSASRPTATSTRPPSSASKPVDKNAMPLTKTKAPPTTAASTVPRTRAPGTTSAPKPDTAAAEKKPPSKPAPAKPALSRTAAKPAQPASSSVSKTGPSAPASRPAAATSRPTATQRPGSASTTAKKAGPAPAKTTAARVPAARDAKLSKDSTNMQLAGARKVDATQRTMASKSATGSNAKPAAGAKPAPTSKYSAVRAVPKVGAAKKAGATAAAAEEKSKIEPAANHNGTPEEKGTLEEKDNKEASAVESESITTSNGSHVECDEASAKSAAVAAADLPAAAPVVDA